MITNVTNNPFRILGVFTNASLKEITANKGKMAAFAKVGKAMALPIDMSFTLPAPNRNVGDIDKALSVINLPIDKIKHALFWFIKTSPMDEVAINHLQIGNFEKASEIFGMKKCYSSLLNSGVLALLQEDIETAVENITELIHDDQFRTDFVEAVCGSTFIINEDDLSKLFIDELFCSMPASQLLQVFKDSGKYNNDTNYIRSIVVGEPISLINREIEKAKNCGNSASKEYNAGVKLMNSTKVALKQLRENLSQTDLQYQTTVDALARQILQCGINYFNASDDDDAVDKAIILQKYALDIAISKLLKDRCQENVDTLIRIQSELPPKEIREENYKIKVLIDKFSNDPSEIKFADKLILDCSIYLTRIKEKIGSNAEAYIKLSTVIAHLALQDVVSELNSLLESNATQNNLKEKVLLAWQVIVNVGAMDVEDEFRNNQYIPNRDTLENIALNFTYFLSPIAAIDLRTETEYFNSCKSFANYEDYLNKYKDGKYKNEAIKNHSLLKAEYDKKQKEEAERRRLEKEKETEVFKSCNSISDYENYINHYPNGSHKREAQELINSKKRTRTRLYWIIVILTIVIIISALWGIEGIGVTFAIIAIVCILGFKGQDSTEGCLIQLLIGGVSGIIAYAILSNL